MEFKLEAPYKPAGQQPEAIDALSQGVKAGLSKQVLLGVTGSGKTYTLANVIERQGLPSMVMAHNKTLAAQLYTELKSFFPHNAVEYFVSYYDYYQPEAYVPSTDTFIEKDSSINAHIEQMRLSATKALIERRDVVVVATVSAIYGLGDPKHYFSMLLHLATGHLLDQRECLRRLASMQYTRNEIELTRGTYRVKGDVIDIFPAEAEQFAIRLELFDDQIEALSIFDPLTGRRLKTVERATVFPKSHYVTPVDQVLKMTDDIKLELKDRLAYFQEEGRLLEAQRLEQRTRYDLEMMTELGYCSGIENYSRYLTGAAPGEPPPTLFDYLPADGLLFVDESHVTVSQIRAMYRGDRSRKETLVEYGFRLPSAMDNRPLKFEEFEARSPQTIYVSATPGEYELEHADAVAELVVRPTGLIDPEVEVRPAGSQVEDVLSEIHTCVKHGERVLITTLTKKMSEDLTDYLRDHAVRVRYLHSDIETVERSELLRDLRAGVFDVLVGINLLREGLDLPEVSLVAIFDADKQGFLRSTRSLIQTIGRAARHLNGKAILYGDKITDAMRYAMDETKRRRVIQTAFNTEHGIAPRSIQKRLQGSLDDAVSMNQAEDDAVESGFGQRLADMGPEALAKELKRLNKEMQAYAKNLEYEKAAGVRDQIQQVRDQLLSIH